MVSLIVSDMKIEAEGIGLWNELSNIIGHSISMKNSGVRNAGLVYRNIFNKLIFSQGFVNHSFH